MGGFALENRSRTLGRGLGVLLLGAVMLLGAACSQVNAQNYAKLDVGMSRADVYAILGEPDQVSGGALGPLSFSTEIWEGGGQAISVTSSGDELALKSIGKPQE